MPNPVITSVGLSALANAGDGSGGVKLTLSKFGLSSQSFDANEETSSLPGNVRFFPIADSTWDTQGHRLHLNLKVDGPDVFDVGAIGVYTDTEILFAVISKEGETLTNKLAHDRLLISFDLLFTSVEQGRIEVVGNGTDLNLSVASEFAQLSQMIINLENQRMNDRNIIDDLKLRIIALEGSI